MVDFRKLQKGSSMQKINPIEIYDSLDRHSSTGPLRPNQEEVLLEWFDHHRQDKDVIIKMHTGEGKTLVGLLLLQSKINDGKGPCLYLCPNNYLVSQVETNAKRFGIKCQTAENTSLPVEFTNGKEILITTVQKLFNGKSVFGIDRNPFEVDSIVLDDSHACMDAIRSSYSIVIKRNTGTWHYILNTFGLSLKKQGEGTFIDIKDNEFGDSIMRIPYWDWIAKSSETLEYFSTNEDDDDSIKFAIPLLKDIWKDCSVYISHRQILIEPDYSLISKFKTFTRAKQRVFMTATTQDDSFFIKGLEVDENTINTPITPKTTKWWGEKMILFPSNIDVSLEGDFIRNVICKPANIKAPNRAVLVPSFKIAEEYKQIGAEIFGRQTILQLINQMEDEGVRKAMVFANRYDGVDLPDDKCRILILDGLPCYGNLSDIFEQKSRPNSTLVKAKTAQKIEQGLGRSVRGERDYSVILLIGRNLVEFVNTKSNQMFFSEQTTKQIQLGSNITQLMKEEDDARKALMETMDQCLKREEAWKNFYVDEMNKIKKEVHARPYIDILKKEKEAEISLANHDYERAKTIYRDLSNNISESNSEEKGWYLEKVAKCDCILNNHETMEKEQMAAHRYNNNLFHIIDADKIKLSDEEKIFYEETIKFISKCKDDVEFKNKVKVELGKLSFGMPAKQFEGALDYIGKILAFKCERPDNTLNVGPDNLWLAPDEGYMAIECKNEVDLDRQFISKDEAGQFNNHIGWIKKNYPKKNVDYIFIHPSQKLDIKANLVEDVRCLTPTRLKDFKQQVSLYVDRLISYSIRNLNGIIVRELLEDYKLTKRHIIKQYTEFVR